MRASTVVVLSSLFSTAALAQPKPAPSPAPAKPAPAPAPAPAADPAPPPAQSQPADVPPESMPTAVRMRRLEQKTQALKERAWQLKARVQMLKEQVLGGGVGAQTVIAHANEMGSSFRLTKLIYTLDGTQVFVRTDETAESLYKTKSFDIFAGPISPGNHNVAIAATYRGHGYGVFEYPAGPEWSFGFIGSVVVHALLPATTIVISSVGGWLLGMRNMMVQEMAEDYVLTAEAKGLRLRVVKTSLVCESDATLMERLLGNLVSNAVRYTERGGVVVGCRRRDGRIRIEVWDSGIGIAEENLPFIFEELYQLNNPTRRADEGLGLGLAIVDRIARILGISVSVHSVFGRGSVFAVDLPCSYGV